MKWLNEPRVWNAQGGNLSLVTEDKTDFWRQTFYGFRHDNGHFYHQTVEGDFTAEAIFSANYKAHYDQAGLMLRSGRTAWVKAGIEFAHNGATLSSVVTKGVSDWAIGPEMPVAERVHLRVTYKERVVCVQWMAAGKFQTLRLGAIAAPKALMVGPMACSPTHGGLNVTFEDFKVGPAVDFAAEV